jgi:HlyD family secretion protein
MKTKSDHEQIRVALPEAARPAAPGGGARNAGENGGSQADGRRGRPGGGRRLAVRRKHLLWVGAIAAAGLGVATVLRPNPVEVETSPVGSGPLETTLESDGITRVVDRFQIAAPVTGRLLRIGWREGDLVASGAEVARIAPIPLDGRADQQAAAQLLAARALVSEAAARVEQTDAARAQTQRTFGRLREVAEAGALSQDALERAELEMITAQREHDAAVARAVAADAELQSAQASLLDGSAPGASVGVRAPAAGQVLRVHEPSERVVPSGAPLLEIGNAARLEIVADVLTTDAVRIAPGSPVRVVDWGGEGALDGRVSRVETAGFTKVSALGVEEQRVNVIVELNAPPPALGDRYRVGVQIITWRADDVLRVPVGAMFRGADGGWAVFVAAEGRARLRNIQVGNRGAALAEVSSGLDAGDQVILFPTDRIRDGTRVRAR